ncbi:MAG: NAD-dependent epimerase/dehydratase family protein [Myxococcota bacterium]|nr:NAD-dependent epimerase/dehydratase family protein [Myxococcota bacterium]
MKVAISGIAGALARKVALQLLEDGHEVLGIDRRPWPGAPEEIQVFRADIRKRPAEEVFRTERPEAFIHMATVTHLSASPGLRARVNLGGTRSLFEHCAGYGVKQALFISRHTVYGAAPDTALYRSEAEPPLAATTFPELADLVAADLFAGSALWRWPKLQTAVLRMVYTLGPSVRGPLANLLEAERVPTVLGFDPLFQFIHEDDAAAAIARAVGSKLRGVFNVTGPRPIALNMICRETGSQAVPIPEPLFRHFPGRFGFPRLPAGAGEHLKYPVVVSGDLFREETGFEHRFSGPETLEAFAERRRRGGNRSSGR